MFVQFALGLAEYPLGEWVYS